MYHLPLAVNVTVRMRSGDVQELPAVEGDRSTKQLAEEIEAKAVGSGDNSANGGSANVKLLLKANFATQEADQSTSNSTTKTDKPSTETPNTEYRLQSEDATVLCDSLWAGEPAQSSRTASIDTRAPLTKDVLLLRFGNVYSDIMTGLHRYSEQGAQRVPLGSLHVSIIVVYVQSMP